MSKVKECPCCGSANIEKLIYKPRVNKKFYKIECQNCYINTSWCDSFEMALDIWNRRGNQNDN